MQYRLTYTIGREIDRDGMYIDAETRVSITKQLEQYFADNFGGATFLSGRGVWNGGPNNTTVAERITHVIVDAWVYNPDQAKHHAKEIAQIALQNSVHLSMAALYAVDVDYNGVVTE